MKKVNQTHSADVDAVAAVNRSSTIMRMAFAAMMLRERSLRAAAEILYLLGGVLLVLVPASPLLQRSTSWDSGIFLYAGWRITTGALPYRDVWDSKPPLIFAINALGLLLSGGSRWGVWALEVVSLLSAALIAFALLKRAFGTGSAIYASFAWLLNAFLAMDGGNYTTEYALPLQFACLWLMGTAPEGSLSARRAFVIGILSGLLFWLKQNTIGIPIAVALYLVVRLIASSRRRAQARALVAMGVGVLLISLIVLAPFAVQGALEPFWDAAFLFNFSYVNTSWVNRIFILRYMPILIPAAGLVLFAFIGWFVACVTFVEAARERRDIQARAGNLLTALCGEHTKANKAGLSQGQRTTLLSVALVALPLELGLVSLPANAFDHYFLALLPVCAVLAALTLCTILRALERAPLSRSVIALFMLALIGFMGLFTIENERTIFGRLKNREKPVVINYIVQNTQPTDYVLIWGSEARVSFAAQRKSPTRYVGIHHLLYGFADVTRVQEFLDEVIQHPPRLILDAHSRPSLFQFPITSPEIEQAVRQIRSTYHERAEVDGWTVYERDDE